MNRVSQYGRDYLYVVGRVIGLVSIFMVDDLSLFQRTAQLLFRNDSVFVGIAANIAQGMFFADPYEDVPVARQSTPTAPVRVAWSRMHYSHQRPHAILLFSAIGFVLVFTAPHRARCPAWTMAGQIGLAAPADMGCHARGFVVVEFVVV